MQETDRPFSGCSPEERPKQKGRPLYGSVPCSFLCGCPSTRSLPGKTYGVEGLEGTLLAEQKVRPIPHVSYDVGGTMGSPYIFQVSGR